MKKAPLPFFLCMIIFLLFAAVETGWGDETLKLQKKLKNLKADLYTFDLIFRLKLNQRQLKEILEIAQKAKMFYLQSAKVYEHFLPTYESVLEKFYEEDLIGNGFSKEVERKTARLHHQEIVLRKQHCTGINRRRTKKDRSRISAATGTKA